MILPTDGRRRGSRRAGGGRLRSLAPGAFLVLVAGLGGCSYSTPTRDDPILTPTPTAAPTPGSPSTTPTPTPPPSAITTRLEQAKRRTLVPLVYEFMSLADMRALPLYGPTYSSSELAAIDELESRAVWTEGELVYFVRIEDGETYDRPSFLGDWHLEVREPSNRNRAQTIDRNVIVEITPHFQETRLGWNERELERLARFHGLKEVNPSGARVRIYGWLMNDYPHEADAGSFRGTSWEIHPITKIEWLDESTLEWVELD